VGRDGDVSSATDHDAGGGAGSDATIAIEVGTVGMFAPIEDNRMEDHTPTKQICI
jgi:hypothetical protein